jgi:group I intron endonuclease
MIGIYKITSPSGKVYIGQTRNHRLRINCYKTANCKAQIKLYNSIICHGWDLHVFEMIEECSIEMLNDREIYWGLVHECLDREKGLNCRLGGQNTHVSEESRKRISESHTGQIAWNKGMKYTDEQKATMKPLPDPKKHGEYLSKLYSGKSLEERVGGKERADEVRKNMSKGLIGTHLKPIICTTTGQRFNSVKEASEILNILDNSIGNILHGRAKKTRCGLSFVFA